MSLPAFRIHFRYSKVASCWATSLCFKGFRHVVNIRQNHKGAASELLSKYWSIFLCQIVKNLRHLTYAVSTLVSIEVSIYHNHFLKCKLNKMNDKIQVSVLQRTMGNPFHKEHCFFNRQFITSESAILRRILDNIDITVSPSICD